ncbi:hypothetical protein [Limnoglobus roseus]|uniref:Uncharacterized protein n=1 Tax=Limnoglobus roseus TaxID=2598579 RepID=A0A5C1AAA7_9BACT|nr:hypothetical protein [Limnoglobus roseus]QEL15147.1 hypothetical protein PX52LOC_02057 [Limnoglobus roseus]
MPTDELGSLSQKARTKSLRTARIIMLLLGILVFAVNLTTGLMAKTFVDVEIDREVRDLQSKGMVIDQEKLQPLRESAIRAAELASFLAAGVGMILILLGFLIYRAPVACTVTGFVLYLGYWFAAIAIAVSSNDRAEDVGKAFGQAICSGLLVRVIIIFCFVKAIRAAVAYQNEAKARLRDDSNDFDRTPESPFESA